MNVAKSQQGLKVEFDELWKLYPRRLGKMKAYKHYITARRQGESYEVIRMGLEKYVQYLQENATEMQFTKHGSTWFINQCWTDEHELKAKIDHELELIEKS